MTSLTIIVDDEVHRYKKLLPPTDCKYANVPVWWSKHKQKTAFACLYETAGATFSMKPGRRGPKHESGAFGDIILPNQGSLSPGTVKYLMTVRLNKYLNGFGADRVMLLEIN